MVDVAVVNTSEETAEVIEMTLQSEGWTTARGYTVDFKRGRKDLRAFLTEHDPRSIVWDIALPYQENWEYFLNVRTLPEAEERPFVLTTTNSRILKELVGEVQVLEIVDKPFSLNELIAAVRRALEGASR
jgi:CheY-like chemotaxis protein